MVEIKYFSILQWIGRRFRLEAAQAFLEGTCTTMLYFGPLDDSIRTWILGNRYDGKVSDGRHHLCNHSLLVLDTVILLLIRLKFNLNIGT